MGPDQNLRVAILGTSKRPRDLCWKSARVDCCDRRWTLQRAEERKLMEACAFGESGLAEKYTLYLASVSAPSAPFWTWVSGHKTHKNKRQQNILSKKLPKTKGI
jgi:hypothetical protein